MSPIMRPTARRGFALALDGNYDVLIVDRMLPKRDGLVGHRGVARARMSARRC